MTLPDTAERRPRHTDGAPETSASPTPTIPVGADILREAAELIGTQAEREHLAYRRGYAEGYVRGREDGEEAGYLEATAAAKRLHRGLRGALAAEADRWPPGGRYAFGKARPGDYPGRGAA